MTIEIRPSKLLVLLRRCLVGIATILCQAIAILDPVDPRWCRRCLLFLAIAILQHLLTVRFLLVSSSKAGGGTVFSGGVRTVLRIVRTVHWRGRRRVVRINTHTVAHASGATAVGMWRLVVVIRSRGVRRERGR